MTATNMCSNFGVKWDSPPFYENKILCAYFPLIKCFQFGQILEHQLQSDLSHIFPYIFLTAETSSIDTQNSSVHRTDPCVTMTPFQ